MKNMIKNAMLRIKISYCKWEAKARWEGRDHWITKIKPSFSEATLHYIRRLETMREEAEAKRATARIRQLTRVNRNSAPQRFETALRNAAKWKAELDTAWEDMWIQNSK